MLPHLFATVCYLNVYGIYHLTTFNLLNLQNCHFIILNNVMIPPLSVSDYIPIYSGNLLLQFTVSNPNILDL